MEQNKKLILVQDCREKFGKHQNIENHCKKIGLPIVRKRLNVGDYRLAEIDDKGKITFINNISVDVKGVGGLEELANDLYRDKLEFNKKYKKCWQDKIKLIVLVEEPIKSLNELVNWRSKHGKISGRFLLELMNTVRISYFVDFRFCDKQDVGKTVISLLQAENRP